MRTIWYMGAKTRLTGEILDAVAAADPRARCVLDLMSGTAAVSQALAGRYRVVANDVQAYAQAIAAAYLEHDQDPVARFAGLDPERDLGLRYRENQEALLDLLAPAVALEDAYLRAAGLEPEAPDPEVGPVLAGPELPAPRQTLPAGTQDRADAYRRFALAQTPAFDEVRDAAARGAFARAAALFRRETIAARRAAPRAFPYLLASSYYPNVYLGVRQAVAVDSLRYAIDGLRGRGAAARRTHYLAALLHATSVTTSATSHFCQPRGLTRDVEVQAVLLRRAQSIPSRLVAYSRSIAATVSATPLQQGNRALQGEWRQALARWDEVEADVVYADPPYTQDHYSRFYHVLEVLTRYDYPRLELRGGQVTKGRYPRLEQRHRSPFCVRSKVEAELRALIEGVAARGAGLVLSYGEENGLLLRTYRDAGLTPARALRRFADLARGVFEEVQLEKRQLLHSGQGDSNHEVTELLLIGRKPRRRGPGCA